MPAIHGKEGALIYDASGTGAVTVTKLQNWSVDISLDTAEITSCGDTYKTFIGGWNDFTATAQYLYDSTGLDVDLDELGIIEESGAGSDPLVCEFYLNDTGGSIRVLHGACILTGITIADDMGDAVKVDMTFQGNGPIDWGTAVPSY